MRVLTCWRDLESFVFNEFLDAIRNEEIVLLVLVSDIAGLEVSVLGEGTLRCFGVLPVTFEYIGAFKPELAWLPCSDFFVFGRHVHGCLIGE